MTVKFHTTICVVGKGVLYQSTEVSPVVWCGCYYQSLHLYSLFSYIVRISGWNNMESRDSLWGSTFGISQIFSTLGGRRGVRMSGCWGRGAR